VPPYTCSALTCTNGMAKWFVFKSYSTCIFAYLMLLTGFLAVEFSLLFQCEAVLGVFVFPGFSLLCIVIVHHACCMAFRGVDYVGTERRGTFREFCSAIWCLLHM
jgi:hypothetical protein